MKLNLTVVGTLVLMQAVFIWFRLEVIDIEQRNFELANQLRQVAAELELYYQQMKIYPPDLATINRGKICTKKLFTYCVNVRYQVVDGGSQFRLAAKSLSWPILYYHSQLSQDSQRVLFAYPESYNLQKNLPLPVYRITEPIFSHPEEWPQL